MLNSKCLKQMISYGNNRLDIHGLRIKGVSGLFDWPQTKNQGNDWLDQHYTEALNRLQDFQYESRKITLKCYVLGTSWANLQTRLNTIAGNLVADGLKMLVVGDYSYRGYMVRLIKNTIFTPARYYHAGNCVATFDLVFEEPQPFSIQFTLFYPEAGKPALETPIQIAIAKTSKTTSGLSDKQQFIVIDFLGERTAVNLEQEDYELNTLYPISAMVPYPFVITGEVDSVENISVSILEEDVVVYGLDTADYFLRNGAFL